MLMNKVCLHLSWFIVASLMVAAGYELYTRDWSNLFVILLVVVLSGVPYVMEKKFDIHTPEAIRLGIIVFLFATFFLGEVNQFYENFFWWDVALHTFAGAGGTLIAYILLVIFYRQSELRSTPFMTSLLAFSLTMTMAVLWEVYEFMIDEFVKPEMVMQRDNFDTMTDFVVTIIGAIFVSVPGYRYLLIRNDDGVISEIIEDGRQQNT